MVLETAQTLQIIRVVENKSGPDGNKLSEWKTYLWHHVYNEMRVRWSSKLLCMHPLWVYYKKILYVAIISKSPLVKRKV